MRPHRPDLEVLRQVERRVLWLAVRMVDHANHGRPPGPVKVGGHQASSASMASIMTALYFADLQPGDRVAVKPHASPVLHAVQYLLGALERRYLTELRAFGGLQAYPSRTKDPDSIDFSTGSVGLGAAMPLFAAVADRYLAAHLPAVAARPRTPRYLAVLGDAELDEGNVWEAIADPVTQGLGNVRWIVDLNRQSLDRVIPGIKARRLEEMFAVNGWHVVEAKYGQRLQAAFAAPGGLALRSHLDAMTNEHYQSLFTVSGPALRERLLEGAGSELADTCAEVDDAALAELVRNLGGHDLGSLLDAFAQADAVVDRPSVVFAYTIKGWGLPMAGDPLNHAALLSADQVDHLRRAVGLTPETEWDRFEADSDAGRLCAEVGARLGRAVVRPAVATVAIPHEAGAAVPATSSTQDTFGRLLVELSRRPELAGRLVTASPDVAVSTNLGGWVNRVGVFSPTEERDYGGDRLLRWQQRPDGQHLELGISEMNLFLLLGALGMTAELVGELLLPIGTVYDPFVVRGLDAFVYALYSGSRFVVVGTPSGVTLAPEGGAHQSTTTASIGMELPGVTCAEPAYGRALDWLLCDGLARVADRTGGESLYLRLTTRPIDQGPFEAARRRLGDDELRREVLAGGYRLREPAGGAAAQVVLAAAGAVLPEALIAADVLEDEGVAAAVLDLTSADRLHRGWLAALAHARHRAGPVAADHHLARLVAPEERAAPIVCVHDAHPHAVAWLGSVFGQATVPLGVETFGQSGQVDDLYRAHDLTPDAIVNAALGLLG